MRCLVHYTTKETFSPLLRSISKPVNSFCKVEKKSNLHLLSTLRRSVQGVAPSQQLSSWTTQSRRTSQRWRAVGDAVFDLPARQSNPDFPYQQRCRCYYATIFVIWTNFQSRFTLLQSFFLHFLELVEWNNLVLRLLYEHKHRRGSWYLVQNASGLSTCHRWILLIMPCLAQ